MKWAIDPGLDGDAYADKPYLYGAAGSSLNILRVGEKAEGWEAGVESVQGEEEGFVEGAEGEGMEWRWVFSGRGGFTFEFLRLLLLGFFTAYWSCVCALK